MLAVVGAHPDDAELGAGGILAKRGGLIVSLTNGANHSRTPAIATNEMKRASEILGVEAVLCDNAHITVASEAIVTDLDSIFESYDIDQVITHCRDDTHPEHVVCCEAVLAACRRIDTVLFFEPMPPSGRCGFAPTVYTDISEVAEKKYEAIDQYASQTPRRGRSLTETRRAIDHWRGVEMTPERAYSEAFQVHRMEIW